MLLVQIEFISEFEFSTLLANNIIFFNFNEPFFDTVNRLILSSWTFKNTVILQNFLRPHPLGIR